MKRLVRLTRRGCQRLPSPRTRSTRRTAADSDVFKATGTTRRVYTGTIHRHSAESIHAKLAASSAVFGLRAALYTRVSTEDQASQGLSMEAQEEPGH